MLRLTGYELGKILKRKIVFAAFALLAVLGGMLYLGDGPQSVISRLPDGTYIGGAEAIAYDKGIAEKYEGVLTEERSRTFLRPTRRALRTEVSGPSTASTTRFRTASEI